MSVRARTDKYKRDLAKAKTLTGKAAVVMQHRINSINFKAVGVAALAFSATFAFAMKKTIDAASDLEETTGKFDVVFQEHIKQAEAMSDELVNSYAMSTREAKQYLSSVQDLLVPMGMVSDQAILMSNEVVKLAADLGSFNNLPTKTVMLDIQSALVGNFETMKKYGVILNETVIKQEALNMGLWNGKGMVDANTKAQVAYKLMLKGSAAALGDQARTMGSYANQIKQFEANVENLKAMIGNELLPEATKIVNTINNWIKANDNLIKQKVPEYIEKIKTGLVDLVAVYNSIPSDIVGVAGYGLVGRILFGGVKGGLAGIAFAAGKSIGDFVSESIYQVDTLKQHYGKVKNEILRNIDFSETIKKGAGAWTTEMEQGLQIQYSRLEMINRKIEFISKKVDKRKIEIPLPSKQPYIEQPLETVIMPSLLEQPLETEYIYPEVVYDDSIDDFHQFLMDKAELEAQAEEERLSIVAGANQAYAELNMSRFDIERAEVERMTEIYRQADVDKNVRDKIASDKSIKIAQAEQQAKLAIYQNIAGGIAGTFQQIAQAGGKQSKAAFKMYKAFAMVEAAIAGYKAVLQAMASYPPPISFVMAGIAAAAAAVQIGMIASAQPPSYDQGGISNARGVYQTGDIQEAHIPIPSGGKIPVKVEGSGNQKPTQIIMNNPVFQDLETQRQVFTEIAAIVAKEVAPGAVVENYNDDGMVRSMVRGGN